MIKEALAKKDSYLENKKEKKKEVDITELIDIEESGKETRSDDDNKDSDYDSLFENTSKDDDDKIFDSDLMIWMWKKNMEATRTKAK